MINGNFNVTYVKYAFSGTLRLLAAFDGNSLIFSNGILAGLLKNAEMPKDCPKVRVQKFEFLLESIISCLMSRASISGVSKQFNSIKR